MSAIEVSGGLFFDYANPSPESIQIGDIARGLSRLPRYLGRTRDVVNVAQHSVLVSVIVPRADALSALLHDAHEAYTGDLPSPAKYYIRNTHGPAWDAFEDRCARAVRRAFGVCERLPPSVKHADLVALATEKRDLFDTDYPPEPGRWPVLPDPLPMKIKPLSSRASEVLFLRRFAELTNESK